MGREGRMVREGRMGREGREEKNQKLLFENNSFGKFFFSPWGSGATFSKTSKCCGIFFGIIMWPPPLGGHKY